MESLIRLTIAVGTFLIMITWEYLNPIRQPTLTRKQRWPVNLGLAGLNMMIMRVSFGSLALISAILASQNNWGLFNQFEAPTYLSITLSVVVLDFAIYCQHIISHKWTFLWRFHQVHHSDLEVDASTAIRFHPIEIILSMLYKSCCILLLGAPLTAVISFEIILNAAATFNHSNIYIPENIDKKLRWLIVTPNMHRIHHSIIRCEADSNYGFSISIWDRFFKTYLSAATESQKKIVLGLPLYRTINSVNFISLLIQPFKRLKPR